MQFMRSFPVLPSYDSFFIQLINSYFSGGMNDFLICQYNPDVNNFSFCVVKESKIANT